MTFRTTKLLPAVIFSLLTFCFPGNLFAKENHDNGAENKEHAEEINPSKIILEHVGDSHEFHFFTIGESHVSIPLPVILYAPEKGFSIFMYIIHYYLQFI